LSTERLDEVTVPDAIEPITAYRSWIATSEGHLLPLRGATPKDTWRVDGADAQCLAFDPGHVLPPHRSPDVRCTCGLYALKERAFWARFPYTSTDLLIVAGVIRLSGRVIEGDYGYRAAHAEVAGVFFHPYDVQLQAIAVNAAKRYGVPLLPPFDHGAAARELLTFKELVVPRTFKPARPRTWPWVAFQGAMAALNGVLWVAWNSWWNLGAGIVSVVAAVLTIVTSRRSRRRWPQ
jgi:hypothetical protein